MKIDIAKQAENFLDHSEKLEEEGKIKYSTLRQRRYALDEISTWFEDNKKQLDTENYYTSINHIKEFFNSTDIHPSKIACVRQLLLYISEKLPEEHTETLRDIHSRFKPSRFDQITTGYHPTRKRKRLEEKLLSDEEIDAAFAVADQRQEIIIRCMLDMGTRPGELAALTPSDFNWDYNKGDIGATVKIEKTYIQGRGVQNEPKSEDGYRTVNLREKTAEKLSKYIDENDIDRNELIFGSYRKIYNAIKEVFTFACVKVDENGVSEFSPHSLRHNTATSLIKDGYSKEKVQRYLGHGSVEVTEIYEHFAGDEVVDIYG